MQRRNVMFPAANARCAGWWYPAPKPGKQPVVVMAHGIGATRELGLDGFAQRLCEAGMCVLAFDYRHYGGSEGEPRELLSIRRQHEDYRAALAFARAQPEVDPQRAVLWGTSLSGGHVLALASHDLQLSAVIAQTPFVSGGAMLRTENALRRAVIGTGLALCDVAASAFGREPVYMPVLGADDTIAAMPGADVERGYRSLVAPDVEQNQRWRNRVAARLVLSIASYEPVRDLARVRVPILFVVAEHDTVCPTQLTRELAARCPTAQLVTIPGGHFDCYRGPGFEASIRAQLAFLREHAMLDESHLVQPSTHR